MRDLIRYIVQELVDYPDSVVVGEVYGKEILELRVARNDLGKIIGKQGRTVRAMRTILSAAYAKTRKRISLEILE